MNERSIPQIELISLSLRNFFRVNYQLLCSEQDQAAFTVFTTHFTADECLPFIINKKNEHPYFFQTRSNKKTIIDFISFDPRLITESNLFDDNRPYRYEQNTQEQQSLFTTSENYNENDNNNEKYTLENQNENRNENIVHHIIEIIQVNIPPQNLQLQHKMHHKLGHQQTTNLLEFQLGLLVQDQIPIIHNHTQIHFHDATLLSTFPLIQIMKYKMKLKI